jgi:hypothetical protein
MTQPQMPELPNPFAPPETTPLIPQQHQPADRETAPPGYGGLSQAWGPPSPTWPAATGHWQNGFWVAAATGPPASSTGFALAALVLGILGLLLSWLLIVGVVLGVLAVAFGMVALKRSSHLPGVPDQGKATAGIVTGTVAVVAGLVVAIAAATGISPAKEQSDDAAETEVADQAPGPPAEFGGGSMTVPAEIEGNIFVGIVAATGEVDGFTDPNGPGCRSGAPFQAVQEGATVTVYGDGGEVIGSGKVSRGGHLQLRQACVFRYSVSDLPPSGLYEVQVAEFERTIVEPEEMSADVDLEFGM